MSFLFSQSLRVVTVCAALLVTACGGGGGDAAESLAGITVGAAGGSVAGPGGTSVVVPPGALTAETRIEIAESSAGAPPLPAGLVAAGPMFAFTPHGTRFAAPVTMTVPFDPALVPAGRTPQLYKTNAQNQWEQVATVTIGTASISAQVTGFSSAQVVVPPLQRNDPVRDWTFSVYSSSAEDGITRGQLPGPDGNGNQTGGLLEKVVAFGPTAIDDQPLMTFTGQLPPDGQAKGMVFGTADGVTYGVFTEAPFGKLGGINQPGGPNRIGSNTQLLQRQSYVKRAADASLVFTLTDVLVCAYDYNLFSPTFGLGDAQTPIRSTVVFSVQAWAGQGAAKRHFFGVSGLVSVVGSRNFYVPHIIDFGEESSTALVWTPSSFEFTFDAVDDVFGKGTEGCISMNSSLVLDYVVDLSTIAVGEEFTLQSIAEADVINRRGGGAVGDHQASGGFAFLRDPLRMGGTTTTFAGLEPTNRPDPVPPVVTPAPPAACLPGPGPDPAAGTLEFSAASYTTDESPGALPVVTVTRTGGSQGAVSARLATSDGTAVAGIDYTALVRTVSFRDGDTAPRVIRLAVLNDQTVEATETINLTLSQPGGCAALGARTAAVLSIEDDDRPPPAGAGGALDSGFGSGGKATTTAFGGDDSAMALQADGKIVMVGGSTSEFVLARFNADGSPDTGFGNAGRVSTDVVPGGIVEEVARAVAIQADGRIVVAGHVRTPGGPFSFVLARYLANGTLDSGFGSAGLVVGPVVGRALAVALQADGRIVVAGDEPIGQDFRIARYLANGSLDASFGTGGQVTTDIAGGADAARNVLILANGSIVASGDPFGNGTGTGLARYTAAGALDPGFGSGGKVSLPGSRVGEGLALQGDGKLVLVGSAQVGTVTRFATTRLLANGGVDAGFGTAGTVVTDISGRGDTAQAVTVQPDGRIVVAGRSSLQVNANFAVVRYLTNGAPDTGFANAGRLTVDFFGFTDAAESVALQADGKIVLGGLARNNVDGYGLARVLP